MGKKIEVGILGATGTVGQRFLQLLEDHPWFEAKWLAASDRSAGKRYREADLLAARRARPRPTRRTGSSRSACRASGPKLVFSSMAAQPGRARSSATSPPAGHIVVSNSSHYRMAPDVPLLVPEINPGHLGLLATQRRERGWEGAIVTNPNCAAVVMVMALAALRPSGSGRSMVTTFQAVSGAGYPGVPSLDILGNVIPYIGGDEEKKVETEPQKILGDLEGDRIRPLPCRHQRELQPGAGDRRPPGPR